MTMTIKYNPYDGNPCSCCGMTISKDNVVFLRNTKGIRVGFGDVTPEQDTGKRRIEHVKTKNGTITVDVKYAW